MSVQLPLPLKSALESGNAVLFLGSGIGYNSTGGPNGRGFVGSELRDAIANALDLTVEPDNSLATIAQVAEVLRGRRALLQTLDKLLGELQPDEHLVWLCSLPWKAIFTTNYDLVVERAYERVANPLQRPVSFGANSEIRPFTPPDDVPIIHLHGSLASDAARDAILVTERDYADYASRREMLFDRLRVEYATSPVLYIGYSNQDPNWRSVLELSRKAYYPAEFPKSFRVTPTTSENERLILSNQGIDSLDLDLARFRESYDASITTRPTTSSTSQAPLAGVPAGLAAELAPHRVGLGRLMNAWDWVDGAPFDEIPNTSEFLKGNAPNWGVFASGYAFERDLEEVLVQRLLNWATEPESKTAMELVLAPAGYGTSTLLRAIAAWYVRNNIGTTLWLRPGQEIVIGDLEFATQHLPQPCIFIVDDAADHAARLDEAHQYLRDNGKRSFLLLGSRINEWRQARPRIRPHEQEILPLSDDEIGRLLQALHDSNSMGYLAALPVDMQFQAIREKNQKELLVTLREATEGRAFDAIVEDEYRSLTSPEAQAIYALAACFHRTGAMLRDGLCGDVLALSPLDIVDHLRTDLAGVVSYTEIDIRRGLDGLRTRHRVIADIVWDRCIPHLEREQLLLSAVDQLNLTYNVDLKAFEALTRDDSAVDLLGSFEAKTDFFERACRRAPRDAYVRQHYARMLRRERRFELALSQIETAKKIGPRVRVIRHTEGMILRDMALSAPTPELGMRRLAQAEQCFKDAIAQTPSDDYSYKSLADLYLDWAKRAGTDAESVRFAAMAEAVVSDGLGAAHLKDGLYVASAAIEDYLGDQPGRVEALKSAVGENPGNGVARSMLGRLLARLGHLNEAQAVLYEGVRMEPSHPRLAIEYANVRLEQSGDVRECIAIVELARTEGRRRPDYLATLGGLYALDGQIDKAEGIWRESADRNFPPPDRHKVRFTPKPTGAAVVHEGVVVRIGAGYAILRDRELNDVHCSGSRYRDLVLSRDMRVSFELGFCAVGPVALSLVAAEDRPQTS